MLKRHKDKARSLRAACKGAAGRVPGKRNARIIAGFGFSAERGIPFDAGNFVFL
jgi:hypothetical protein